MDGLSHALGVGVVGYPAGASQTQFQLSVDDEDNQLWLGNNNSNILGLLGSVDSTGDYCQIESIPANSAIGNLSVVNDPTCT